MAQGLAWQEGPWQDGGEKRRASVYLQRAKKLPQLQLSQRQGGRQGVGQGGGSMLPPLDRVPAPTRPFTLSSLPAALRAAESVSLAVAPDPFIETLRPRDRDGQRPQPRSPCCAGPGTPDSQGSLPSRLLSVPSYRRACWWLILSASGMQRLCPGPSPLFPAGLGQIPVNNMLPINQRSLRPGPIDGRRQLGRRVMKCQLVGGGAAGPGI